MLTTSKEIFTQAEREVFVTAIVTALREEEVVLTADERKWLTAVIEREKQAVLLRKSIIEKTLTSLIWAGITAVCTILWNAFTHSTKG